MDYRISLTRYANGKVRITGGLLHNVVVHDWTPSHLGKQLIWMDELGIIRDEPVFGFIYVKFDDVAKRSPEMARRAIITNTDDLKTALQDWDGYLQVKEAALRGEGRGLQLHRPGEVFLGIQMAPDHKNDSSKERDLPEWAVGYQIIEEQEPYGCFGALGYGSKEDSRFVPEKCW
jgi:hypothetical protein